VVFEFGDPAGLQQALKDGFHISDFRELAELIHEFKNRDRRLLDASKNKKREPAGAK
jgi:hypothetical protein